MHKHWHGGGIAAGTLLLLALAPVRAADPPGDLWQTTSQMIMAGMPFTPPPTTLKLCTAREWTKPPPGGDASCVNSNYKRIGNQATWTVQCGGRMPMTGTGEMTWDSPNSYTGVINATAEGMTMVIKLSGTKIGTCDKPIA